MFLRRRNSGKGGFLKGWGGWALESIVFVSDPNSKAKGFGVGLILFIGCRRELR